ncbi:hypothetical protein [uncultured Bacteroides sp.]|uniref:hypothetical protein n=1 Tax=uncultured Bacteroides sp. TaxID=162156 RepID=UPI0025FF050F|nr:hypothetical protein [uncultured Bacteroides sp.]
MRNITLKLFFLLGILLTCSYVSAQKGAPHTLRGESLLSTVSLQWKSPVEATTLQWHSDDDYDGESGISTDGGLAVIYMANKFTATDLKEFDKQIIDSIFYFHYRPVFAVTVQLYENGKLVNEQPVDISTQKLNTMAHVKLDKPYTIHADVDLMVVAKIEHGTNIDFVAIMDRGPAISGKGDLYSYDGKNWKNNGRGNFLVTAHIEKEKVTKPDGYNIYRNDVKVNAELLTETSCVLQHEPGGEYTYTAAACYGTEELKSYPLLLTNEDANDVRPAITNLTSSVEGMKATLTWNDPIILQNPLTWSTGELGTGIGGTSTSSPKIWVANAFTAEELASYSNHEITALNVMFNEAVITMKLFVMQDGTIIYSEDVPAETVASVKLKEWVKFSLATPIKIQLGSDYRMGYYITHVKSGHPAGVDKGPAVDKRGNYYSTSTPKSAFNESSPSWSLLSTAKVASNWMLSADIKALDSDAKTIELSSYDVYRNDEQIATGITEKTYTDESPAPGTYTYSVVANYKDGKKSPRVGTTATFSLPDEYVAPMLLEKSFKDGVASFAWSQDAVELKHYDEAQFVLGLDNTGDDVDIYYGTNFAAEELAPYVGRQITGANIMIGAEVKSLEVLLLENKKTVLAKKVVDLATLPVQEMTIVSFDAPVTISAEKDLTLVYHLICGDKVSALVFDGGPLKTGGAIYSFDGTKWNNFSMVSSSVNNNNVVIGAVVESAKDKTTTKMLMKGSATPSLQKMTIKVENLKNVEENMVSASADYVYATTRAAEGDKPVVKSYKVYCNGELVKETEETSYVSEQLSYGYYAFTVSAVYSNGWESAPCTPFEFEYEKPFVNETPAPYALTGTLENKNLSLTWQSPSAAMELSWQNKNSESLALGMTASSKLVTCYATILYTADELKDKVGKFITHIKFSLANTDLSSASVLVFYDKNIAFEQVVPVDKLVKGENIIQLDKPMEIFAGREVMVGYFSKYASGVKPNMVDKGPAVEGKGNLISSSGSSWSTLNEKSKNELDYNWRISAVLQDADKQAVTRAEESATTYNLYIDGTLLKEGIQATNYTVENAADGSYTVTAVAGGVETAASNAVIVGVPTGIDKVEDGSAKAYYDSQLQKIVLPELGTAYIYSVSGTLIKQVMNVDFVDMSELPAGVYVVRAVLASGEQMIKVLK